MLKVGKETETLFTIHLDGRISADEMNEQLDHLIELSADVSQGKLLYDVRNFRMPEFGALMVEFRKLPALFGLLRRFDKAAVLADEAWLRKFAEWEGALLPGLEIRSFPLEEEQAARAWLAG
ncbi:MAG: STAS/SEC14 domain-containing protein [Nitratireductor sp.]